MAKKHIYLFLGTMAELIKLAPVIRELQKRKIKFTIIVSGQTDIHFDEFKRYFRKPDIIYAVTPKSKQSSILKFSLWTIRTFFSLLIGMRKRFKGLQKSNSYFIVHGDTVSSLMGAFVAYIYGLKIVHIESGLRSFNFLEPFPEEICRYIISRLADIHFCPNRWCKDNLTFVRGEAVNTMQNTLIESFYTAMKEKSKSSIVKNIQKKNRKYFVLVVHRQEHVLFNKDRTRNTILYLLQLIPKDMTCVFMTHDLSSVFINSLNMIVRKRTMMDIVLLKRLQYRDFMHLIENAEFFVTDGGSNQEEMYYMGKPCLLLRNCTERIEGLGKNVVLGNNDGHIVNDFIYHYKRYQAKSVLHSVSPSLIIVNYLLTH